MPMPHNWYMGVLYNADILMLYNVMKGSYIMKKLISEKKWNRMFDDLSDGFCEEHDNDGNLVFKTDKYNRYMDKVINMSDYKIVGIRHQIHYVIHRIKEKVNDYKLSHLRLGKLIPSNNDKNNRTLRVKGISFDAQWQMNRILAIVIRDYLRTFIKETPAIGNCVLRDNPEGLSYFEASQSNEIDFTKRWEETVNDVANDFDMLRIQLESCQSNNSVADDEIEKLTQKAFSGLTYIFNDLNW